MEFWEANWWKLAIMAVLLGFSAFFSSSETALFSLRTYDLKRLSQESSWNSRLIVRLLQHPHRLLITILFCNLVVNLLFFSFSLSLDLEGLPRGSGVFSSILTVVLVILFGEIVPKSVAVTIPLRFSRFVALPIAFFQLLSLPVVSVLERVSNWFLDFFPKRQEVAWQEIKKMLLSPQFEKALSSVEVSILKEVVDLYTLRVQDVMIPRVKVVALDEHELSHKYVLEKVAKYRHSYYPVYRENLDRIVGILPAKRYLLSFESKDPVDYLLPPVYLSEYTFLHYALDFLKKKKISFALVVDEYGSFSGIVTLEDIVEEIFGELQDEFDPEERRIRQVGENTWVLRGDFTLRELKEWLEVDWEEHPKVSTIGGFVAFLKDGIPRVGDVIEYKNWKFRVLEVEKQSVKLIQMERCC